MTDERKLKILRNYHKSINSEIMTITNDNIETALYNLAKNEKT